MTRLDNETVLLGGTPLPNARSASGDLVLAVQTEKLLIDDGAQDSTCNRLTGTVTDIVYQGESLRIFIALEDGSSLSLRQPSHYEAIRHIPPVGDILHVSLPSEDTTVVPKAPSTHP